MEVQINLNNPDEVTIESVAKLIASKDDSADRQLRVTKSGIAFLSDKVGAEDIEELSFRLETWDQSNGYCGIKASQDVDWINKLHGALVKNWPEPNDTYIGVY